MRESQIVYQTGDGQNGDVWVCDADKQYTVYVEQGTHAKADTSFPRTPDGLALAKYRADYLQKQKGNKRP